MNRSHFSDVKTAVPDPILGVTEAFRNDQHPNKVNLGVGVYQDAEGRMPLLKSISKATQIWTAKEDTKTYLPIDGVPGFIAATQELLFGKDSQALKEKRIATIQSVGGSGALKLGVELIKILNPNSVIHVSDPTWENHRHIFNSAGVEVKEYPYYDPKTNGLRAADMLTHLRSLPAQSVVLLHACCHNPTGVDLDIDSWGQIAEICAERSLIPFIDAAYQGFADGLSQDAAPIRLFAERGLTFLVSNSYAKSCSMYRERCGALSVVTGSAQEATAVTSQVKRTIRTIYSSPPSFGAQVIAIALTDPELRPLWEQELEEMRQRIHSMRKLFTERLAQVAPKHDFSFILKQRGMFSYSGLSAKVVQQLRELYHIYALESGRICVAAMNTKNMDYICNSIASVLEG
ncbi:MAG: aromatic amino acid transaminase [Pseudomonadota bacterium]